MYRYNLTEAWKHARKRKTAYLLDCAVLFPESLCFLSAAVNGGCLVDEVEPYLQFSGQLPRDDLIVRFVLWARMEPDVTHWDAVLTSSVAALKRAALSESETEPLFVKTC